MMMIMMMMMKPVHFRVVGKAEDPIVLPLGPDHSIHANDEQAKKA